MSVLTYPDSKLLLFSLSNRSTTTFLMSPNSPLIAPNVNGAALEKIFPSLHPILEEIYS